MKEKALKNTAFEIRALRASDGAEFLAMLLQLDRETENMMYEPDERPRSIPVMKPETQTFIVLAPDGKIVGFLSAERGQYRRLQHSAYVVVGILAAYRGQGLGKALFEALDAWAKATQLTRLELTVMTENLAALGLYQKMGFEIEGLKRQSLQVKDHFVDEYYMAKLLSNLTESKN